MLIGVRVISVLISLVMIGTALMGAAAGDRGGVPINTVYIDIHEPGQKAIICWDGTEELLVLSTDMRADSPTKVLEIMPLPAEPKIKTVNETLFSSLKYLVEEHSTTYKDEGGGFNDRAGDSSEPVDVEIIFHDKLGVHNLTVIKAISKEGFANFVAEFMSSIGLEPMSFPGAEEIADAYIKRNINYFVLDVIELTTETKSPEPLMYRFVSDGVFYPMEITSLTGGTTHILLFILTPQMITKPEYEKTEDYFFTERIVTYRDEKYINIKTPVSPVDFELVTTVDVTPNNLQYYSEYYYGEGPDPDMMEIYEFFEDSGRIKIGVYEYDGPVEMEGDIYIKDYSEHTVELYSEYDVKESRILLVVVIPPIILVVAVVGMVVYLQRKQKESS